MKALKLPLLTLAGALAVGACQNNAAQSTSAQNPPPPATPAIQANAAQATVSTGFSPLPPLNESEVIATVRGKPVLAKDIAAKVRAAETKAQADYLQKVHQVREQALKNMVIEQLLEEEAKKAGVPSIEEFIKKEAEKARKPATDERLKQMYGELVPPGGPPFEEVKMQLAQRMAQMDAQEAVGTLMDRLMKENDVKWELKAPELPKVDVKADDDPVLGDKNAKVEIIEFSDFQCPYCSRAAEIVHQLVDKYPGKVKVVFRDFPLSFHENAKPAAIAANCANEQGKFWAMHDQMFKNQNALDATALKTYARVAGLSGEKFDQCLTSKKYDAEVEKDMKDGETAGVEGTPAFFINGRPYGGAPTIEDLSRAVDQALAEG